MDVFENEKPNTYSEKELQQYRTLLEYSNGIFSPHVAGWTHESKENHARILIAKIKKDFT